MILKSVCDRYSKQNFYVFFDQQLSGLYSNIQLELQISNLKRTLMPDQQMVVVDSQDSVKTNAVN